MPRSIWTSTFLIYFFCMGKIFSRVAAEGAGSLLGGKAHPGTRWREDSIMGSSEGREGGMEGGRGDGGGRTPCFSGKALELKTTLKGRHSACTGNCTPVIQS